jgi:ATP-dependent Clp protease ATP-binding subunit ClpA
LFERFTDRAQRVVVFAQEESRLLNHDYIGTEHILLGLIHEGEGVAAMALGSLGISLEEARRQVEEIIGAGQSPPSGHIPFTPRAKKVLEMSLREALDLGYNYIGTEHILLGVIAEGKGVAARVLIELGAGLAEAREAVIQSLSGLDPSLHEAREAAYRRRQTMAWTTNPPAEGSRPPLCSICGTSLTRHLRVAVIEVGDEEQTGAEGAREVPVPYCGRCGHAI